jgi:mannan endo-1,4-beta-mannosidase
LERYPGDKYVDLLGMDNYWDFTDSGDGLSAVNQKLRIVSKLASDKNKIAALTETGLERIPDSTWWTQKLLKTIIDDSIKISYVMVWRNAHPGHYYVPYKGDKSADDFIRFKEQLNILFEDELPPLYYLR